ncbi:MAG: hypothetical protein PHE21_02890 [Candidatus Dojkabacteria bacterium]|nr:hypothetical protein [Candidatus Dojkabacteria bacterium]
MKKLEVDGHIYEVKFNIGELIILKNEKNCYLYSNRRGIFAEVIKCGNPPFFIKKVNGNLTFMGISFKVIQRSEEGKKVLLTLRCGKTQLFFHIEEKTGKLLNVTFPIFN